MKRSIRPSTPADAPAIVALLKQVGLSPNLDPQHLHWKYWQARGDWTAPRSFVLTDGGEPIAHTAIIPGAAIARERRECFVQMIDWAARPGEVGAGVALMKYLGQQVGSLLSIGGSKETLRILPHVGFRAAGVATGYVRTLFPTRLLRDLKVPLRRRLPRFARSVAWTLGAPGTGRTAWRARRLADVEVGEIAHVFPNHAHATTLVERSTQLLQYMLCCPILPITLYAVECSGDARGYFVLASAPGQSRVIDCWVDSDSPSDWSAMIQCAVAESKRDPQAAEVVIWASDPLLRAVLPACGFHARNEIPLHVRPAGDGSPLAGPLRVQMLETDTAYLHDGRAEFWA